MSIKVETFFDKATFTLTYLVYDENSKDALLIDPVMNFDIVTSSIAYHSVESYLKFIKENSLTLHYVLESHAHADHLSGAAEIKKKLPKVKVAIGSNVTKVQKVFAPIFNNKTIATDGSQFDVLLQDQESLKVGSFEFKTIFTPGHTPACCSFLVEDMLFVGDLIFMPDSGSGRCDFPDGSAEDLYDSIVNKVYTLPDETKVFVGHDYQPNGRELEYQTTVGFSKKNNIQLKSETTKEDYIMFRTERDALLKAPKLLLPSIQVNIAAGELPAPDDNGTAYLRLPLKVEI